MVVKRYRLMPTDFDSRAVSLKTEVDEARPPEIRAQWLRNQGLIREQLLHEYGVQEYERKIADFTIMSNAPFSVLAFHNRFYRQARDAFVIGAYYPALVGTCALGERILNHLILKLRDRFVSTPEYKQVYRKESLDNWPVAIDTLVAWDVFNDEIAELYRKFAELRNRSIHFRPDVDDDPRQLALDAIRSLGQIIDAQFGTVSASRWCIMHQGEVYVRSDVENRPVYTARVHDTGHEGRATTQAGTGAVHR